MAQAKWFDFRSAGYGRELIFRDFPNGSHVYKV